MSDNGQSDVTPEALADEAKRFRETFAEARAEIGRVMVGQVEVVEAVLTADGPDQREKSLDEKAPGIVVPLLRSGDEVGQGVRRIHACRTSSARDARGVTVL